jgi:hypothetical protein
MMRCAARRCDELAIRTQTYQVRGCPRVHLCATHWIMADEDTATLWKLVGIPGYAGADTACDRPPEARG